MDIKGHKNLSIINPKSKSLRFGGTSFADIESNLAFVQFTDICQTEDAIISITNRRIIEWRCGTFLNGLFTGNWQGGTFKNGTFHGNWHDGFFENGTIEMMNIGSGIILDGNIKSIRINNKTFGNCIIIPDMESCHICEMRFPIN